MMHSNAMVTLENLTIIPGYHSYDPNKNPDAVEFFMISFMSIYLSNYITKKIVI